MSAAAHHPGTMNARENFHAMMGGTGARWLPLHLAVTPPVADEMERRTGHRDPHLAFDTDFGHLDARWPKEPERWRAAFERLGSNVPATAEIGQFGVTQLPPPPETVGPAYHLRTMLHPLEAVRDAADLATLPFPDLADRRPLADAAADVAEIHARGKVAWACLECTFFEMAWYLRGMDALFCDLAEGNGIAEWLLDYFTRRSVLAGEAFARAGADMIGLGDDVGTQKGLLMSADMWRELLKPRLAEVVASIRRASAQKVWIHFHSDGDISPLLDDLVEIGIDIVNPVQPECMDAATLVRSHGSRLGLSGMVGTQTTMPFGSVDDVRARVRQIAALHRELGARVMVAPTHVLEPDVPYANIEALVSEARLARF